MRAGGFTLQQTLTTEAASILKHSLSLAKRRGHAQITPLHVAATLLSDSRTSLLKRACLKSHPHSNSHPLQCRALELCFNVALNRLPTTHPSSHLLHHGGIGGGNQPCLSNALIAALKRAQAHQRRGCIENQQSQSQQQQQQQQQPLLAIKVELEQLIISILDDPSVSRVMREAGFSSISVKNNLEDLSSSSPSSVFQYNSAPSSTTFLCSPPPTHDNFMNTHNGFWQTHFMSEQNPFLFHPKKNTITTHDFNDSVTEREKDLRLVFDVFSASSKRRNTVIVGDCLPTTEGLVEELMNRVQRSIGIPNELRSTHVLKFQFSLKFMKRSEVEMKVSDLRSKVSSLVSLGNGVIIYVGDLKWVVADENENYGFLVEEIGRLISDFSSSKVWLLATANYQTFMKCQAKQPYESLEMQWFLQAVSVPSGGLGLSLHGSSGIHSRMSVLQNQSQMQDTKPFAAMDEQDKLTCCAECTSNFERDAGFFKSGQQKSSPSFLSSSGVKETDKGAKQLPYWLQPNQADSRHKDDLVELRRKWNRLCHSLHHPRSNQLHPNSPSLFNNRASSFPWWTSAAGSNLNQSSTFRESNSINFTESISKPSQCSNAMAQFGTLQPSSIDFGFSPNGTSKQNPSEPRLDSLKSMENKDLKITLALGNSLFFDQKKDSAGEQDLRKLLQENIPWQSGTVRSIAEALLNPGPTKKNGNWLFVQGTDLVGKRRLARAISKAYSGSPYHLVNMNMRRENEANLSCRVLLEALKSHEKCVVLIEEIDFADTQVIKFLMDGFQSGRLQDQNGREISLSGATFVVMTSTSSGLEDNGIISMKLAVEGETCPSLRQTDSIHKRKAESELPNQRQSPRTSGDENTGHTTKVFSRQSSSNTLDLNLLAEAEDEDSADFTPVPSDLTQETDLPCEKTHCGFFESIGNRFVLDRNSAFPDEMAEKFKSKINGVFAEVFGNEKRGFFSVDQEVLDELVFSCGSFLADLFDKWLVDIFQTSLLTVKKGGGDWGTVRVTLGGIKKGNGIMECGYMGSNLPTSIQV
ncbi:hypothetical protein MKW94_012041 [Papaver nudicaule]|uniref:Clp R domain-containing protein n=1 Tax=Papaver nudicaule TaxID=74823 RepID=A0AA41VHA1_PAPNU|nr:hypothetical protein [Papaver nudicaule]